MKSKLLAVAFAAASIVAAPVIAQDAFPSKPVRFVVPFPTGGGADTLIRLMSPALTDLWKQSVLVENKSGASGHIGAADVAKSAPDGYTLMMGTTAAISAKNVDTLAPVALVSASPYLLTIHPSIPAKSVAELISYGKANPGALKFGSSGPGSASHLSGELFKAMSGVDMLHVPYKGTGQALTDLIAGTINVMFAPAQTVVPNIQSNRLKGLAVTSARRSASLPEYPTIAENGLPGYESVGWFGVFAPAKTPAALINKINADINKTLGQDKIRKDMLARGSDPGPVGSADDFAKYMRADMAKWAKLIKEKGLEVQ